MANHNAAYTICEPPRDRQAETLLLVLRPLPAALRADFARDVLAEANAAGGLDGLFEAYRDGQLTGATWCQMQTGGVASVWLPQIIDDDDDALAIQLLARALDFARAHNAALAQSLITPEDRAALRWFSTAGFEHASDLLYLIAWQPSFPPDPPQSPLEFETYSLHSHDRLCRLIERTYVGTADCPRMNGVRAAADVLASYQATGEHDSQRWLIAQHDGADAGCLLVTDHPRDEQCELLYMGLVPELRGRKLGAVLARQAQWLTRQAGRARLALAVDSANWAARRTYEAVGFELLDRRHVFLRVLSDSPVAPDA